MLDVHECDENLGSIHVLFLISIASKLLDDLGEDGQLLLLDLVLKLTVEVGIDNVHELLEDLGDTLLVDVLE